MNRSRQNLRHDWQSDCQLQSVLRCHKLAWLGTGAICLGILLAGVTPIAPKLLVPPAQAQAVPAEVRQGFTLLGRGLVGDAIRAFRQAVQRYPQSLEAKLGLAIAYRRAGQDENSFRTYEQVLAQDPNNVLALKSIGLLGGYRAEWQNRGIQALTVLLNLNPNDTEARAQRALLLGYQARFAESLADYELVLRANPTPDVLLGAAQSYTYAGDYARAIDLFNRYRQTGARLNGFAAIAYARALRSTGNASQAVQLLGGQLTSKLDQLGIQTRVELSQAYLANNQPTQALAVLDPLRDRAEAALPLARALNEVGRQTNQPALTTQAIALYRRVLSLTSNPTPALLREVADVFSGQPQERATALQIYRQLAQVQPNDRGLQIKRLALENQLGYLSKADLRQQLRPLIEPLPTDPFERRAIAQALTSIDPDPDLLPIYQALIQTEAGITEPFLNFRLAQILIARNDLVGARNALAAYAATPQGSRDLAPQLLAAEIERREGSLDAAARRYEAILAATAEADIANAALRGLAGIRLTQGRSPEALQIYDQLVARNPQDLQLQLGRASIAYQAKQISEPEAQAVLDNWLRTRPPNDAPPELFSLVGALPPDPRREALYTQLATADPNYIPIQLRRIQVLAARNPAAARAQVIRIFAQRRAMGDNDVNAALLQGQLAQAVGDAKLADEAYQSVLTQAPDNTDALIGLGSIRLQQRRLDAAEEYYNLALALKPNDLGTRQALIEVTVAQDRPLDAIRQLEELQLEQAIGGDAVAERRQKLEEDLLRRRGFQPAWERY